MEPNPVAPAKRNLGIVTVAILLFVVVVGIGYYLTRQNTTPVSGEGVISVPEGERTNNGDEAVPLEVPLDVAAMMRKAIDGRDASLCGAMPSDAKRAECNMNVLLTKASDAKDKKLCEGITDVVYRTACTDNIIFVQARDAKTPALCQSLVDITRTAQCEKEAGRQ